MLHTAIMQYITGQYITIKGNMEMMNRGRLRGQGGGGGVVWL